MSEWEVLKLHDWVTAGDIELGRGNIISKDDINAFPGPYPIYSSSAHNNGKFGEYAKYMFDEELITWSVDGGGNFFYRPKHKFSVTNVCGYMRIKTGNLHTPFIYYCLANQHNFLTFDYTTKAHPSVIRKLYWLPKIEVSVQRKIAHILQTIDQTIEKTEALIEKYQKIKTGLMHDLFTRGIDADGKLRPSREHAPDLYQETPIGWIPKEWNCINLNQVADLVVGFAFKSEWFQEDGVNLLRGENVGYGNPDWKDKRCLSYERAQRYNEYLLHEGDVVIGMDRAFTKSGVKITVMRSFDCPSLLVQRVGKFVAKSCYDLYLRWLVLSPKYLRDLINQQKGMDIPHLSKSEILAPFIPLPPEKEQREIALRIDLFDSNIQKEVENLEKMIDQKSGLMHDLLTGKVTVKIESGKPNDNKDQEFIKKLNQISEVAQDFDCKQVQEYV
jgi:type I restriction enzyme, S subunit